MSYCKIKYTKTYTLAPLTKIEHCNKLRGLKLTEITPIWPSFSQYKTTFVKNFRHCHMPQCKPVNSNTTGTITWPPSLKPN